MTSDSHPPATADDRPLRVDAERNRQALLKAAAELFAARGLGVSLTEIARHAGVGVATAYRRYPNREDLVRELFSELVDQMIEIARRAAAQPDPWTGLVEMIELTVTMQQQNNGLREIVLGSPNATEYIARLQAEIAPAVSEMITRAQATGQIRTDISHTDVPVLHLMLGWLAGLDTPADASVWRRQLQIALDGLRTPTPTPLPGRPLTIDELQPLARSIGAR